MSKVELVINAQVPATSRISRCSAFPLQHQVLTGTHVACGHLSVCRRAAFLCISGRQGRQIPVRCGLPQAFRLGILTIEGLANGGNCTRAGGLQGASRPAIAASSPPGMIMSAVDMSSAIPAA